MSLKGYSKHNLLLEPPLLVPPGYDWQPFEQWLDRNVMGVAGISWTNMCRVVGALPCLRLLLARSCVGRDLLRLAG